MAEPEEIVPGWTPKQRNTIGTVIMRFPKKATWMEIWEWYRELYLIYKKQGLTDEEIFGNIIEKLKEVGRMLEADSRRTLPLAFDQVLAELGENTLVARRTSTLLQGLPDAPLPELGLKPRRPPATTGLIKYMARIEHQQDELNRHFEALKKAFGKPLSEITAEEIKEYNRKHPSGLGGDDELDDGIAR